VKSKFIRDAPGDLSDQLETEGHKLGPAVPRPIKTDETNTDLAGGVVTEAHVKPATRRSVKVDNRGPIRVPAVPHHHGPLVDEDLAL